MSQNIPCPTVITDIQQERHNLELLSRTAEEKDAIIADLRSHKRLEETLTFATKTLPLQNSILFGVPVGTTFHYILDSLDCIYEFELEDVTFLKAVPYRSQECRNWFLLLPLPLAAAIINDGGIPLGLKMYRLRPFTEVQR